MNQKEIALAAFEEAKSYDYSIERRTFLLGWDAAIEWKESQSKEVEQLVFIKIETSHFDYDSRYTAYAINLEFRYGFRITDMNWVYQTSNDERGKVLFASSEAECIENLNEQYKNLLKSK